MVGVKRCPRCEMLTMLTSCPNCRMPTAVWAHGSDAIADLADDDAVARIADYSVESPSAIMARRLQQQSPSVSRVHASFVSPTTDKVDPQVTQTDDEKTKEELLAELCETREHRDRLATHLDELLRENATLTDQLEIAKSQMVLSASDIRDLHASRQHIRRREVRAVEQVLRQNSELRRRRQQEEVALQIPERRPGEAVTVQRAVRRSQSCEIDAISSISALTARTANSAKARASQAPPKANPLDTTPISIAFESVTPAASLQHGEGDGAEVARLQQALREREGQLRDITRRARQAEAVVQKLVNGLDGAQDLLDASEVNRSPHEVSPQLSFDSADDTAGGAPSHAVQQQYESLLARQGLEPYSRHYVGAAAAVGYNGRDLPSSYPHAPEAPHPRSVRVSSLVN